MGFDGGESLHCLESELRAWCSLAGVELIGNRRFLDRKIRKIIKYPVAASGARGGLGAALPVLRTNREHNITPGQCAVHALHAARAARCTLHAARCTLHAARAARATSQMSIPPNITKV